MPSSKRRMCGETLFNGFIWQMFSSDSGGVAQLVEQGTFNP
jgi:hypothetical protein